MFTGTTDPKIREYEIRHGKVARMAAEGGIVLLKNEENVLPFQKGSKLALFGGGARRTIKGGTGSGDVNERHSVSIEEGLLNAGFQITTDKWLDEYDRLYDQARLDWRQKIWDAAAAMDDGGMGTFHAYSTNPFSAPAGPEAFESGADTAIYVLSRIAGEGADRELAEGDYYLSCEEEEIISDICSMYGNVVLLINTGGIVDLSFIDKYDNIKVILYISQPGQEGGNAVASILTGNVSPSGKLTDSWPYAYGDIPNSDIYSHLNGNVETELYNEGIYVGYRYFDTYDVTVRYCFGFGLSYTDFQQEVKDIRCADGGVSVDVEVKNTGDTYGGREVVQVYVSCPQGSLKKEYRRLVGFAKTALLAPGESEKVTISFPVKALASYCEKTPGWILEEGIYGIFVGTSLDESEFAASLSLDEMLTLIRTENICPLKEELDELDGSAGAAIAKRQEWLLDIDEYPSFAIRDAEEISVHYGRSDFLGIDDEITAFVDSLNEEQLIQLATGDIGKSQNSGNLGSAGIAVPGSAAQTSDCAAAKGLDFIVLADGPAGLRLTKKYFTKDGQTLPMPLLAAMEGGFLLKDYTEPDGEAYYQYCTAFPVGTLLAMSWDSDLVEEVGRAVAEEMKEFNVTLWLAPGMNIHRNPLCGRNFEYYSEDPVVSGTIAAAMTKGVQSIAGCGTTIKHFACNSQEDNRMGSNSVVSERALREIYLKGFELAIRHSQPLSIMTSYNLINGVHAANCADICTKAARDEWDFKGVIMTDWMTTLVGPDCTAAGCMRAGNDLVMPGNKKDHDNMKAELEAGTLSIDDIKRSVRRLVKTVWGR